MKSAIDLINTKGSSNLRHIRERKPLKFDMHLHIVRHVAYLSSNKDLLWCVKGAIWHLEQTTLFITIVSFRYVPSLAILPPPPPRKWNLCFWAQENVSRFESEIGILDDLETHC